MFKRVKFLPVKLDKCLLPNLNMSMNFNMNLNLNLNLNLNMKFNRYNITNIIL